VIEDSDVLALGGLVAGGSTLLLADALDLQERVIRNLARAGLGAEPTA
jgi:hypothetical protein